MNLRVKLVLAVTSVAAVATVSVGAWSYRATGQRLRAEVDRSLDDAANDLLAVNGPRGNGPKGPPRRIDDADFDRPRQFQHLIIRNALDLAGVRHDARIRRVDPVNISVILTHIRFEKRPDRD